MSLEQVEEDVVVHPAPSEKRMDDVSTFSVPTASDDGVRELNTSAASDDGIRELNTPQLPQIME